MGAELVTAGTTFALIMAMRAEAQPVIEQLALSPTVDAPPTPMQSYSSTDGSVVLVVNGADPIHGVDSIGTTPGARSAEWAVDIFSPTWLISTGTCGGFAARGGRVGDVIVASGPVIHHDRRVDIPGFDAYARGEHPTANLDDLARQLGFTPGPCSTGDSLDAPPLDLAVMEQHGTLAKDMEAAAVAGVARRHGTRFTALKVITDIVDGPLATPDEFQANLGTAVETLADALPRFLAAIATSAS